MTNILMKELYLYLFFIVPVVIAGLYCILVTRNLMRILIGIELLMKAVTLLLIAVGHIANNMALAQAIVINLIVIEVVVVSVIGGVVLNIYRNNDSLYVGKLRNLKG